MRRGRFRSQINYGESVLDQGKEFAEEGRRFFKRQFSPTASSEYGGEQYGMEEALVTIGPKIVGTVSVIEVDKRAVKARLK